jgi:hypothetical protein
MASTSVKARPRPTTEGKQTAPRPGQHVCQPRRVDTPARRRIASNFAFLSAAELVCRTTSVIVTLSLAKRLGVDGYGRIEFAFNVVFWLVLLLRDSSDVIVARELSRHPRLIRPLVDQVLAYKTLLALVLFSALAFVGSLTLADRSDWRVLVLYGSMLFTTAIGLDFVFRGTERMGLVALSLCIRTGIYAVGVLYCVRDASRIAWVPLWLTGGEVMGISIVWLSYLKNYRMPRPRISLRFLSIMVRRGRTVCLIQLSQAVIISADLLVVGFLSSWGDVGLYGAPYRMVTALLTFGLILQQAAFPTLSRLWREKAGAGVGAGGRGLHDFGRSAGAPRPSFGLCGRRYAAGAGNLAGTPFDSGLSLSNDVDSAQSRVGRRAHACRWGNWNRAAGRLASAEYGASRGVTGRDLDRAGPGLDRVWMSGTRGTSAGLASSSGSSGSCLANDDSGVPGSEALPRALGRAGRGHHLHRVLGCSRGLTSHSTLEASPGTMTRPSS